jgi:hypothetical protein
MTDKEMAIAIRAALLAIVDALERRYGLGKHARGEVVQVAPTDSLAVAVQAGTNVLNT